MKNYIKATAVLAFMVILCGCGGSIPSAVYLSGDGYFDVTDPQTGAKNSYYHDLDFVAPSNGYIEVRMSSEAVDSIILVYRGTDDSDLIGSDDDSGGPGRVDAFFTFYAIQGVNYKVRFSTYDGKKTGLYTWSIDQVTTRSIPNPPDPGDKPNLSIDEMQAAYASAE